MKGNQIPTYAAGGATPNGVPTGIDWRKADRDTEAGRKALAKAIGAYFGDVTPSGPAGTAGMKTTRTGHITGLPSTPEIDVNFSSVMPDLGVMSAFRYVDKRSSKNSVYQMANVGTSAIVFSQKREGQAAQIQKVAGGTPVSVASVTHHGALGIDDEAERFDDYGVFEQNVQAVPNLYQDYQATLHAALFTALGAGVNQTFDTDLQTTVNNGCKQILDDVGDRYGVPEDAEFVLMYNPAQWHLVLKAFASMFTVPNDNNSVSQFVYNLRPVRTRKIAAGSPYLILAGHQIVTVEWDGLYSEYGRDHMRGADAFVWRARRNAAIGDTQQVRRIALS